MNKVTCPLVITFLALSAAPTAAVSQSTLPLVVPPPPPQIKSGIFHCSMYDETGDGFALEGQIGNWRKKGNGSTEAEVVIEAPDDKQLSGRYIGPLDRDSIGFDGLNEEHFEYVRARVDIDMDTGHNPKGAIFMVRRWWTGDRQSSASVDDYYVGICNFELSTDERALLP